MPTLTYETAAPISANGPPARAESSPPLDRKHGDDPATAETALILFARQLDDRDTLHEQVGRLYPWLCRVIGRRSRGTGMRREDTEDAQQETIFALLEAIVSYDPCQGARPGGCSFRTFLGRCVVDQFLNRLRRLHWEAAHRKGESELVAALEGRSDGCADSTTRGPRALERNDPAIAAQIRQLYELIGKALERFPPEQRLLWEGCIEGVPLEQLAQQAGVSRLTVIRRIQQVNAHLRVALRDYAPEYSGRWPTS